MNVAALAPSVALREIGLRCVVQGVLLATATACALVLAAPARADTTLWSQPTSITDINQILKVYPAQAFYETTYFMQYQKCKGGTADVRISDYNLGNYTGHNAPFPLSTYQMGCSPAQKATATEADDGYLGYIADDTSITPTNQGGDWWFAKSWASPPGMSTGTTVFRADAIVPWEWSGKLNGGVWNTQALPAGMGGGVVLELGFVDGSIAPPNAFYVLAAIYDSRGAAYGNPPDQISNCGSTYPGGLYPEIIANFNENGKYSTQSGSNAPYQTALWNTWKTFAYAFTPAQLVQMAKDINTTCAANGAHFSTTALNYGITSIAWGTELNVWGTGAGGACPCLYGYSHGVSLKRATLVNVP